MTKQTSSARETARLAALTQYRILDTPPETAFDDVALLAARLLAAPIALISFIDEGRVWNKAQVGLERREAPRESSFCQYAILQDDLFVVPDAMADRRLAANPWVTAEPKVRFFAGVPLRTAVGYRLGALCVFDRVPRRIDATQEEILRALARQVMALLEQRRALGDLSRDNQQLRLLSGMSRKLLACPSSSATHAVIADFGNRVFPEDSGRVFLRTGPADTVVSVASWGDAEQHAERLHAKDCLALRARQPHAFTADSEQPLCPHLEGSPVASSLCVPLKSRGETLGLLTLVAGRPAAGHPASAAAFDESKWSSAVAMAQSVALAVGHLQIREALESQTVRDPLTGLFNRRYLEVSLERELAHASRHRLPLGLIMIDLDRFKDYNDSLGHPAGDELLGRIAELLKRGVRAGDIACRYGGDEFAIILPGASLEITRVRAGELLQSVKRLGADSGRDPGRAVTLSTGIAAFPQHGVTAHVLLHAADVALYQAKAQGRDPAVVPLVPTTLD